MMVNSRREYDIKGIFTSLKALVGVDDNITNSQPGQTIIFIVSGDGKELWRSNPLGAEDAAVEIEVPVAGIKKLILSVEGPANVRSRRGGLPADWAKIQLVR